MPSGKDVLVKSIQMHDDPVHESKSPARVGLAIKGISAEEISRGNVVCSPDYSSSHVKVVSAETTTSKISTTNFAKNPYYKGDLA